MFILQGVVGRSPEFRRCRYKRRAWKENMRTMMESGRLYCSLGFSIARGPIETVSFELFQDLVPITARAGIVWIAELVFASRQ